MNGYIKKLWSVRIQELIIEEIKVKIIAIHVRYKMLRSWIIFITGINPDNVLILVIFVDNSSSVPIVECGTSTTVPLAFCNGTDCIHTSDNFASGTPNR